ncbi:MAG TPA: 16S rRNA (guanine(527)-N(7))-methyltransferase RsmG [Chitinophagales bacterium]|nr:16S rRNA (guanine(527)-N(7))-methyltransferase RsmG [Chitinophagales bacterium]
MNSLEIIEKYFPDLTDLQKEQYERLVELYKEWNEKINVISRKDMDEFVERHLLHSLSIAKYQKFKSGWYVVDLGTGGGFPGIPLAIMFPEVHFILVDSIGKKIKVVDAIVADLELTNVKTVWGRVEQLDVKANLIVTRAVAPLAQLVEWTRKILKTQSKGIIALKGGDLTEEMVGFKRRSTITPINEIFSEPYFETKSIVHYKPSMVIKLD